jgi:hypothetical protein
MEKLMQDGIDDDFADVIGGLNADRITVAAVEGAVHDLAGELEWALRALRDLEADPIGYNTDQVRLQVRMAEFALRRLCCMFDTLAALDAEREGGER